MSQAYQARTQQRRSVTRSCAVLTHCACTPQVLSDPSQRSLYDANRRASSYEDARRGEPGYGRDTARAGGASAGGRAWSDAQQRQAAQERVWREWQGGAAGRRGAPPGGGFTQEDADRIFRDMFGNAAGLAELLRKTQRQQAATGSRGGGGLGGWDDFLGQVLRSAAAGARTEVRAPTRRRCTAVC